MSIGSKLFILLFSAPSAPRTCGGYFGAWVKLYWIDNLNVNVDYLGLVGTCVVPIYFLYFLWFGLKTDVSTFKYKNKIFRRKPLLLIFMILTFLTWYTWLFNPFSIINSTNNNQYIILSIYFGIIDAIYKISGRSWSVTMNALGIQLTENNQQTRTNLFGYSITFAFIGALIGATIPGYISTSDYWYFLMIYSIFYLIFASIYIIFIKEPQHKTNYSDSNQTEKKINSISYQIYTVVAEINSFYIYLLLNYVSMQSCMLVIICYINSFVVHQIHIFQLLI